MLEGSLKKMRLPAVASARETGALLRRRLGRAQRVTFKGAVDLVTESDHLAEALLVRRIRRVFPDHAILTEERPELATGSSYRWILDPLDGTTNYAHGYPCFAVSIALEARGRVVLGVVYDPMREELFLAEEGKGATCNGRRIRVSGERNLSRSLLVTGFAYDVRESPDNNLDHFARFTLKAQGVRRTGSAALDLCYVAAGRFDGFWELKLQPWDTAAGMLIVRMAGGRVTDFAGRPFRQGEPTIIASNGRLHRAMLGILAPGAKTA
ncbi:MAG: inositol monophosphatase [Nitrospirae bacterium]|nr:inositol monophosphatase [Nitrospirota bacterium]